LPIGYFSGWGAVCTGFQGPGPFSGKPGCQYPDVGRLPRMSLTLYRLEVRDPGALYKFGRRWKSAHSWLIRCCSTFVLAWVTNFPSHPPDSPLVEVKGLFRSRHLSCQISSRFLRFSLRFLSPFLFGCCCLNPLHHLVTVAPPFFNRLRNYTFFFFAPFLILQIRF